MGYMTRVFACKNYAAQNRLVMPPMAAKTADDEGRVTENMLAHYDARTQGGCIGTVIVEFAYINKQGRAALPRLLAIDSDDKLEGLRQLVDVIHGNGSKAIAQIYHGGGTADPAITGMEVISPSGIKLDRFVSESREMTRQELRQLVEDFVSAAIRAKTAGFDGVEIHSAHGYLLSQFCSPITNQRTDEYGGSIENRLRIHREVIAAVREAVGEDYPIFLRLGCCDYMEGGNGIAESVEMARILAATGIDVLDISAGVCGYAIPAEVLKERAATAEQHLCYFDDVARAIRTALREDGIDLPLILTGAIGDINLAERLVAEDYADLIGVGRALLQDADWARKALA